MKYDEDIEILINWITKNYEKFFFNLSIIFV